eukprot:2014544-Amphidinium_carterae.1
MELDAFLHFFRAIIGHWLQNMNNTRLDRFVEAQEGYLLHTSGNMDVSSTEWCFSSFRRPLGMHRKTGRLFFTHEVARNLTLILQHISELEEVLDRSILQLLM